MKFLAAALAAMAAVTVSATVSASAQMISSIDAGGLEAAMNEAGLNPELQTSTDGSPVATGTAGDFEFYVRGLACSGSPVSCENIMFFANFDLGRPLTAQDYRIVNSYNDSQVFGRAYALQNSNEVGVDYVIELGGGVSPDHLSENIGRWADVVAAFVTKFQEGLASS